MIHIPTYGTIQGCTANISALAFRLRLHNGSLTNTLSHPGIRVCVSSHILNFLDIEDSSNPVICQLSILVGPNFGY